MNLFYKSISESKRILWIVMLFTLSGTVFPVSADSSPLPAGSRFYIGELRYEVLSAEARTVAVACSLDGESEQTPDLGNPSYPDFTDKSIVIPSTVSHDGVEYTVTEIGRCAFWQTDLTDVTLPPDNHAFQ